MGCVFVLFAALGPRVAFVFTWLLTDRVSIAFSNNVIPFIGMIFFPWTALVYTFAYAPVGGVSGLGWLLVALAFLVDIAAYGGGERERRNRYTSSATL